MHTVLNKNTKAGLWLALGASLPELPYSFLAVLAVQYVSIFQSFNFTLEIITAIVLLSMGTYEIWVHSRKKVDLEATSRAEKFEIHPFWKGILIALFNPMLVAFWLVTSKLGANLGWFDPHQFSHQMAFVLGTALGAFVLLVIVAFSIKKIKERITPQIVSILNRVIGITFLILGIVQTVKIFITHL